MSEKENKGQLNGFFLPASGKLIERIYFIGIGGIGMSALARYCNSKGMIVSGYDKTESTLTRQLTEEGIMIHYIDDIAFIDKEAQLIVYTPAIPPEHKEMNYYREKDYTIVKRSDLLSLITNGSFNICIAGTHGKTTTSTMIAHILRFTGFGCNAFLGGISVNYGTNFWSNNKKVCVVEADEYDRSFLKLSPDIAIITAMDADHLDIYGTAEKVQEAFIEFSERIKPGGLLINKKGLDRSEELYAPHHMTYHLTDKTADAYTANTILSEGSYHFDIVMKDWELKDIVLNMGGTHNIENVLAATVVSHYLGIEDSRIKDAIAEFSGVKRRFEYIIKNKEMVMIDDYAHHPEELMTLLRSAKELFPDRKCTIIFQPHLYTRTRDFGDAFAASLDHADEVMLLPIYPARELPIEGVNSEMILKKMTNRNVSVKGKDQILAGDGLQDIQLLIMSGAGDIEMMVDPVKHILLRSLSVMKEHIKRN